MQFSSRENQKWDQKKQNKKQKSLLSKKIWASTKNLVRYYFTSFLPFSISHSVLGPKSETLY
jgi:hypothetical protein